MGVVDIILLQQTVAFLQEGEMLFLLKIDKCVIVKK
jgi:hypothetical protein